MARFYAMTGAFLTRFTSDTSGASAIEYAIIAGGIGLVIVTSVATVGSDLNTIFVAVAGMF